jgi:hypothetical protein
MSAFHYVTCPNKLAKQLTPHANLWGDFELLHLSHEARQQKDGQAFIFATFSDLWRKDDNVLAVTAIALDVDSKPNEPMPPAFEVAVERLQALGVAACAWTTHSHTPESPRYRIVCPLHEPMSKEALPHGQTMLADALGLHADPKARNAGRLFYAPACPPDRMADARSWLRSDAPKLSVAPFERRAALEAAQRAVTASKRSKWKGDKGLAGKVLERAVEAIQRADEGERNETLNRWAFIVGKAASKGEVSMAEAEAVLVQAAMSTGLQGAAYTARRSMREGGAQ